MRDGTEPRRSCRRALEAGRGASSSPLLPSRSCGDCFSNSAAMTHRPASMCMATLRAQHRSSRWRHLTSMFWVRSTRRLELRPDGRACVARSSGVLASGDFFFLVEGVCHQAPPCPAKQSGPHGAPAPVCSAHLPTVMRCNARRRKAQRQRGLHHGRYLPRVARLHSNFNT